VGQAEVDIAGTADLSIVMVAPGAGDDVQALKAGVMEIADIFVVNKSDREGADQTMAAIAGVMGLRSWAADEWKPPIVKTVATTGSGMTELVQAIEDFRARSAELVRGRRGRRAELRRR